MPSSMRLEIKGQRQGLARERETVIKVVALSFMNGGQLRGRESA
jgi:hypothetical protein